MVKEGVGSLVWLRKHIEDADSDLLREMVKAVTDVFMSAEASAACGAPYGKPSADRVSKRNGYRERRWDSWGALVVASRRQKGRPLGCGFLKGVL